MSLECYIGPELNLLETTAGHANRLHTPHPILTNEELAAIAHMHHREWRTKKIDITFDRDEAMVTAIERICAESEQAIEDGFKLIILTDRAISAERVPVSALIACGAVHHHLVARARRTQIGIVVETGEAREVHHHSLLIGYGR